MSHWVLPREREDLTSKFLGHRDLRSGAARLQRFLLPSDSNVVSLLFKSGSSEVSKDERLFLFGLPSFATSKLRDFPVIGASDVQKCPDINFPCRNKLVDNINIHVQPDPLPVIVSTTIERVTVSRLRALNCSRERWG